MTTLYSLDTKERRIIRHGSNTTPYRAVTLPNETYATMLLIREGLTALMNAGRAKLETGIDAWQDVLSVYFAHWEE